MVKWSDDFASARSRLETLYRGAIEWHDEGILPPFCLTSVSSVWMGDYLLAERCMREIRDLSLQFGQPTWAPLGLYIEALIAAHQGRADEARRIAPEGIEVAGRTQNHLHRLRCIALIGFLDLSLGNPTVASTWLERATELARAASHGDPGLCDSTPLRSKC
jgi:hypothetical protein